VKDILEACAQCLADAESKLQESCSEAGQKGDADLMEALAFVHQAQMAVSRSVGILGTGEGSRTRTAHS
jgi:hypothetical protein